MSQSLLCLVAAVSSWSPERTPSSSGTCSPSSAPAPPHYLCSPGISSTSFHADHIGSLIGSASDPSASPVFLPSSQHVCQEKPEPQVPHHPEPSSSAQAGHIRGSCWWLSEPLSPVRPGGLAPHRQGREVLRGKRAKCRFGTMKRKLEMSCTAVRISSTLQQNTLLSLSIFLATIF